VAGVLCGTDELRHAGRGDRPLCAYPLRPCPVTRARRAVGGAGPGGLRGRRRAHAAGALGGDRRRPAARRTRGRRGRGPRGTPGTLRRGERGDRHVPEPDDGVTPSVASTVDDTRALGRRLGAILREGDLVVLTGPLGAGKTALAQGIGAGLGVTGEVTSPTFVIARVHRPDPARGGGVTLG